MNKTAIKNFAIWARNKLIADIQYRAGLMGITADGIRPALPQSTKETEFYDIGTAQPYAITGEAVRQRKSLVDVINQKANETNYKTAYKYITEGVAYTWFNRLIAVRFMEINDYLPSHIRVLSSDSGKMEPDLVTTPFDADLIFTDKEKQEIVRLKNENNLDECFRLLFIKQCNALNEKLPALFEKTADYTELLLNISVIDKEGVVYHLVNDISEDDFNIEKGGQVEIIGWLYQYYNTEPKNEAFSKNGKITKEEIPAVTQLFTPDWIVRYMVENSLGRLWVEGHPNDLLKSKWKYYLEEAEQEPEVQVKLDEIHKEYAKLNPEDIHFIDPCMGSGHILVYAFDVLMQIYESVGYSQRDAAKNILENNLYGLDIDDRAYQMAYFAVMMKARQYNRRILSADTVCHVYSIQESNHINRQQLTYFGVGFNEVEKNDALNQIGGLLDTFKDAKEYGSILNVADYDWDLLRRFAESAGVGGQMTLDAVGIEQTQKRLQMLIDIGEVMARKYEVVATNPPYANASKLDEPINDFVKKYYPNSKADMSTVCMEKTLLMLKLNGLMTMINIPVWMFLSTYERLRENLMDFSTIISLIQPGRGIFGSDFGTTSFIIMRDSIHDYKGHYRRLFIKQGDVQSVDEREKVFLQGKGIYFAKQEGFRKIPGSPIAYWASPAVIEAFVNGKPLGTFAPPKQGSTTGNNDLFLRLWFEVIHNKKKWFKCLKGGAFRKWYGNQDYYIDWEDDGRNIKAEGRQTIRNAEKLFEEGVSWSRVTIGASSFRIMPKGYFFESASGVCFPKSKDIPYTLGVLNSKVIQKFAEMLNPTATLQSGDLARIPVLISDEIFESVTNRVNECILISREDWDSFETSWNFEQHPLIRLKKKSKERENKGEWFYRIEDSFFWWENECDIRFNQLKINEEELNRIFIDIYGLQGELTPEVEDKDVTVRKADLQRDIKSLISYAVGCMFGRYSLDVEGLAYAGGDWDNSRYNTFIPDKDNIIPITDEEYFEDDILGLFCSWLKKVYGKDTLERNLDFIASALKNKGDTSREIIRNYFVNDFFKDHCTTYSVTGSGKRPIYWLFDSGKQNGFKALIYLHRYNADTVGNLRVDYLHRMQ
ncbi:MAG: BREX-1 system adenine-specific DNA-methyltransferase PglX, partial [Lachnospiraceae bacterium]|nr:BREX-1 system adenine-specific DNA-methyltransferase PglX [Lachnospiraceae bacterium]